MGSLFSFLLSFIWRFRLFASRFLSSKGRGSGDFLFGTWIAIALGISLWYWTVTNADSIVFRIIIVFISYLKTWADLRTLSLTSSQGWCQNLKRNTTARDEYCMDLFLFITERTIMIWNIACSLTFLGATLHIIISLESGYVNNVQLYSWMVLLFWGGGINSIYIADFVKILWRIKWIKRKRQPTVCCVFSIFLSLSGICLITPTTCCKSFWVSQRNIVFRCVLETSCGWAEPWAIWMHSCGGFFCCFFFFKKKKRKGLRFSSALASLPSILQI